MKVHRGQVNFSIKNPVVAIGMFDGIHRGHKQIIERTTQLAYEIKGESVIMSFEPHPRLFFSPHPATIKFLTSVDEKISLLEENGIDHFILYPFTHEFSAMSSCEFIESVLVQKIGIRFLVAGYNHHFGRNREGTFQDIIDCAAKFRFGVEKLSAFLYLGKEISSSLIRKTIENNDIKTANQYLGYNYQLTGSVVKGNGIGRTINFPTANIIPDDPQKLVPPNGVYAVRVITGGKEHNGLLNIGTRPTINNLIDQTSVEVHIIDFNNDIYNESITVNFINKIREEKKFDGLVELKHQIKADLETANNNYFL